jgi:hypothetical protein
MSSADEVPAKLKRTNTISSDTILDLMDILSVDSFEMRSADCAAACDKYQPGSLLQHAARSGIAARIGIV